ncbi:PKD domain-containing protein [Formosa sp. PL04]|uniref:PKD domain-containing protein n=1 Tax=Formosa sp. PL04 TaxID=3081755 RepID=UPI0029819FB0|nr:PKD domain-containing protein [Formosa sp. PL04]MDW5290217.1 PKD domain-containing protein [Formosa sp. PL04]
MKKITLLLCLCVISFTSCKNDDDVVASVIDCAFEWDALFDLTETVPDATTPLVVEFTVSYIGTGNTLDHTVTWDFGDGNTETTGTTATHTYAAAGTYEVKAHVKVTETGKDGYCEKTLTKTITVTE